MRVGEEQARVLAEPAEWPESLWLRWPGERLHWFDAASGARLSLAADGREPRESRTGSKEFRSAGTEFPS